MIDYKTKVVGANEDILIISIFGRMDGVASDFLYDCFKDTVASNLTKVVLDCGDMEYMSSAGLSALVRLHSRLKKAGGQIKLCNVNATIVDVLKIVNFDKLFGIYSSVDEAISTFDK